VINWLGMLMCSDVYSYQAAIKDFINLAREGKKDKKK